MDIKKEIERRFALQEEYLGTNKPVNKIEPLVSISVATYQHVNYIKKCLDGILMQKTNFPFEVIVGEDESTDGTRDVCIEYAEKHPDKIRLFLRDRVISHLKDEDGKLVKRLNGVLGFNRMSARGKYIALCEGDDYWTDPWKLQKQVDILEKEKQYSLVFSNRVVVNKEGSFLSKETYSKNEFTISDVYSGFIPATQTIVFRNFSFIEACFKKHITMYSGDRLIAYLCAMVGDLYCLHEETAAYRVTGEGVWTGFSQLERSNRHEQLLQKFHADFGWDVSNPTYVIDAFERLLGYISIGVKKPSLLFKKEYRNLIKHVWTTYRYMNRSKLIRKAFVQKWNKKMSTLNK